MRLQLHDDAPVDLGPQRIFLDERDDTIFATVDYVDYHWAIRWRWHWKWDKRKRKRYAQRRTSIKGRQVTLFLHKEVLLRKQPNGRKPIGDHVNGDSLDCRRDNLNWATRSENNANRAFARCPKGRFA